MQWKEKRFCHIQLEIVQNMANSINKHAYFLLNNGTILVTVAANVLIVKLHEIQDRPTLVIYVGLVGVTIVTTVAGYMAGVFVGDLRSSSVLLVEEIELEAMQEIHNIRNGLFNNKKRESLRHAARRFRRCPIRIQLSIFTHVEAGIEVDFLRSIIDNTVNWIFMVTLQYQIWLI